MRKAYKISSAQVTAKITLGPKSVEVFLDEIKHYLTTKSFRVLDAYGKLVYQEVRKNSIKTFATLKELKKMGHPYAVNYPSNNKLEARGKYLTPATGGSWLRSNPWIINAQSTRTKGRHAGASFHDSWHFKREAVGGMQSVILYNDSSHAVYLSATKYGTRMIPRPIIQKSVQDVVRIWGNLAFFYRNKFEKYLESIKPKATVRVFEAPVAKIVVQQVEKEISKTIDRTTNVRWWEDFHKTELPKPNS